MIYKGKIAIWYYVFWVIFNIFNIILMFNASIAWIVILCLLLWNVIFIPNMIRNYVELKEESFVFAFGFSKKEYKYTDIICIERNHGLISSAACSLDRVYINLKDDELNVSLKDNETFMEDMKRRNNCIIIK